MNDQLKGPTLDEAARKHGLCITRRPSQGVLISHPDGEIEVTLISTSRSEARLLFSQKSRKTKILRKEIVGSDIDKNWKPDLRTEAE